MLENKDIAQIIEFQATCHDDDRYVQDGLIALGPELVQTAIQANVMWEALKKLAKSHIPGVRREANHAIAQVLAVKVPRNPNIKHQDTQVGVQVGEVRE